MADESVIDRWHRIAKGMTSENLDTILADDVVFHSPVVHTPQEGRDVTKLYLMAAFGVMPGGDSKAAPAEKKESKFRYVREVVGERDAVLEFVTEIDGIVINGIDMIHWNDDDEITDFKVMIRPLKAIQKIHGQMAAMLEKLKPS